MTANIILLGPPASGKGTQSQWITRDFNLVHVSTGDMLRKAIADGTPLGKIAKPLIDEGQLVPDEVVNGIVREWLRNAPTDKGIIFDGFPRTVAQAKALDEMMAETGRRIDAVFSLDVTEQVVVDRIGGRRSCPVDGSVYHVTNFPPKVSGKCDKCGGDLVQRSDDNPENIVERYHQYLAKTRPLVDYYKEKGVLVSEDGAKGSVQVFEDISRHLKNL